MFSKFNEKVKRRYFKARGELLCLSQPNKLALHDKTIVTIFHDFEGDYSKAGRGVPCLKVLDKLLDIETKCNIKGTYNTVAKFALDIPEIITEIKNRGHEIASHSYDHNVLALMSKSEQVKNIVKTKNAFLDIGIEINGHRSPESKWTPTVIDTLLREDFIWIAENGSEKYPYVCKKNKTHKLMWFPVKGDDWNYEAYGFTPKQMLEYWKKLINTAREKKEYIALGIHPWVQDEQGRLEILEEFLSWLSSCEDVDVMSFSNVCKLMSKF